MDTEKASEKQVILITGSPGIGKTTLIKRWAEALGDSAGGFYTQEIRGGGARRGFEIITSDGQRAYLAKKSSEKCFRREAVFGRYRVNLEGIDDTAVASLLRAKNQGKIVFVDEIGPMECFSRIFCDTIRALLDDPNSRMIGTVVKRSHPFANEVKRHPRVRLIEVTAENRRTLAERAGELVK